MDSTKANVKIFESDGITRRSALMTMLPGTPLPERIAPGDMIWVPPSGAAPGEAYIMIDRSWDWVNGAWERFDSYAYVQAADIDDANIAKTRSTLLRAKGWLL